jgi:cytoskeletal protein RodZ
LSLKNLTKIYSPDSSGALHYFRVEQMLANSQHEQVSGEPGEEGKRARSVGVLLRSAREARAMTVREVAERIHIPAKYLTMLEANDYSAIADELYLLPFVRGYAEFLGLDAGTMSARFVRGIQPLERVAEPAPELAVEPAGRRSGWFTTAAVMLFVALALYLVGLK